MAYDAAYEAYVRLHGENGDLKAEIDRLKTELAAAQKDAARWRWMRDNISRLTITTDRLLDQHGEPKTFIRSIRVNHAFISTAPETADAAVDAALNAQEQKHIYL